MKLFLWLAILGITIVCIQIILYPEILNERSRLLDLIVFLFPIGFYLQYRRKAKTWGGQFIEWAPDYVEYKCRQNKSELVRLNTLINIDIKLDEVILTLTDGKEKTISLEDYTEYSDRIKIKENFECLKVRLKQ